MSNNNGSTRKWRTLRAQVIREEPRCWLQLPGCTHLSNTADHIIPLSQRPDLRYLRTNLRGACRNCNYKRGNNPIEAMRTPHALNYFTKTVGAQHD